MARVGQRMYLLFGQVCRLSLSLPAFISMTPLPLLTNSPPSLGNVIRDSGVNAIESLMARRGAFDYILLETTGLADPGNIAPLFWVDEGLGSTIYLDGIVTLVDAKNILRSLDDSSSSTAPAVQAAATTSTPTPPTLTTAHLQISHADVLVVNKSDLVSPEHLESVTQRLRAINGLARICVTQHGRVPERLEGFVLDMHAYDDVHLHSWETTPTTRSVLDPVRFPLPNSLTIKLLMGSFLKKTHKEHINPHTLPHPAGLLHTIKLPRLLASLYPLDFHPPFSPFFFFFIHPFITVHPDL